MSGKARAKIGELVTGQVPETLVSFGLGSCVGLVLYDSSVKTGGLAHILLPSSLVARDEIHCHGKYADRAVKILFQKLLEKGCVKENIKAKMAGGATMFGNSEDKEQKSVGERNAEAVVKELEKLGVPLEASDTGGRHGRTIEFDLESGMMFIKSLKEGNKII